MILPDRHVSEKEERDAPVLSAASEHKRRATSFALQHRVPRQDFADRSSNIYAQDSGFPPICLHRRLWTTINVVSRRIRDSVWRRHDLRSCENHMPCSVRGNASSVMVQEMHTERLRTCGFASPIPSALRPSVLGITRGCEALQPRLGRTLDRKAAPGTAPGHPRRAIILQPR